MAVLRSEAQVNLLEGILRDAAHASDPSRLQPSRERFIAAKSALLENVSMIAAGRQVGGLSALAGELLLLGEAAGNIFELREAELAAPANAEVGRANRRQSSNALADQVDRLAGPAGAGDRD